MKPAMPSKRSAHAPHICILLVDDHPAVRHGLALLLAAERMEVCTEAGGRAEALACLKEHHFNLAIVDLSLNGEDGITLVADLHQRSIPVLVYSMHNDAPRVQGAFAAGALGYVTKQELDSVLLQAIREVAAGHRFVSPEAAMALAEGLAAPPAADALQELSPRERKVYELLGRGSDTFDIAAALHVTNHTVESYYSRILVKLNLNGMHELRLHAIDYFQKHTG